MNEASITILVAGLVQVVGMIVGFATLWVKLRYASVKAEEASAKASGVERKLDDNTATTKSVESKADVIVEQTNGSATRVRLLTEKIAERVSKLEDYNHETAHRLFDALNLVALKVERLVAAQEIKSSSSLGSPAGGGGKDAS